MKKALLTAGALAFAILCAPAVRAQVAVGGTANSAGTCQTSTQQVNVPGTSRAVYVDKYGNLCVNDVAAGAVIGATTTEAGGSVTTSGTFQQVLASSAARKSCLIQNTSTDTLYVFFGATASATTSNSFALGAAPAAGQQGGSIGCSFGSIVATDNIAITSKTTNGATFVVSNQ